MPRKTTKGSGGDLKVIAATDSAQPTKKTTPARKTAAKKTTPRTNRTRSSTHPAAARKPVSPEPAAVDQPAMDGQWRRMDLHMHTPASRDYEQPEIHYVDILRQAERRGLDIIAFTDHNTVNGYRNMQREIAELELLERLGRIRADEMGRLSEYRRLLKKVLVLPGFEVTATFGFHVIGLFPPDKPLRDLEYILLQLRVPPRVIDQGLTEAGATSDVLTTYRLINEAGGIVIAPHANSSNGVFMRGMNIGGQTRMAYTQDEYLHAIELTDLAKGRRSMAMWFSGSKPEYSRRMHILQGSDAHRLTASPTDAKRLGMGDRATEVFLPELSFSALRELFLTRDFTRERPAINVLDVPSDVLRSAREKGDTATQCFHAAIPRRGDKYTALLSDVSAFANASGGTIYVGCDAHLLKPAAGVPDSAEVSTELAEAVQQRITPALTVTIDLQNSDEVDVLRVTVPRGDAQPYAVDGHHFFVRNEAETHLASRDEIVAMVRHVVESEVTSATSTAVSHRHASEARPAQQQPRQQQPRQQQPGQQQQQRSPQGQQAPQGQQRPPQGQQASQGQQQGQQAQRDPSRRNPRDHQIRRDQQPRPQAQQQPPQQTQPQAPAQGNDNRSAPALPETARPEAAVIEPVKTPQLPPPPVEPQAEGSPRSGVEILSFEEREGTRYFTVRDLRNRSIVRNVTQKSARDLWLYAIMQELNEVYDVAQIQWQGDRSILSRSQRAGKVRYDLALRDAAGKIHIFYGVSDDTVDSRWKDLILSTMPPVPEEQPAALITEPPPQEPMANGSAAVEDDAKSESKPVADAQPLTDNTPVPETQP